MPELTKRCSRCGEQKPLTEFSPRNDAAKRQASSRLAWCRPCMSAYSRKREADRVRAQLGLPSSATRDEVNAARSPDGRTYTHRGYVLERRRGHHRADRYGYVPQHILVAEVKYGLPITQDFTVHHRNNDKADNRPENLDLRVGNHGVHGDVIDVLLRTPELRARARELLAQYDD